jgi:hypothetical protein
MLEAITSLKFRAGAEEEEVLAGGGTTAEEEEEEEDGGATTSEEDDEEDNSGGATTDEDVEEEELTGGGTGAEEGARLRDSSVNVQGVHGIPRPVFVGLILRELTVMVLRMASTAVTTASM